MKLSCDEGYLISSYESYLVMKVEEVEEVEIAKEVIRSDGW